MNSALRTLLAASSIGVLAACSSSDGDSEKVSQLETDLAAANKSLAAANTDLEAAKKEASGLRAEASAQKQYSGLLRGRIRTLQNEEYRAPDGSTLRIDFRESRDEENLPGHPDIVLQRTSASLPALGDWEGEVFEASEPRSGASEKTTLTLYRTQLGTAGAYLQFGYWQSEAMNSSGRSWFTRYGSLMSIRPSDPNHGSWAAITDLTGMEGSATFRGHAAGLYAISNPSGGHNEDGQFTADAMLTVDFGDGSAKGMIDNFMSAGESKEWTVELLRQNFDPSGPLFRSPAQNDAAEVQWTISADQNTPGDSGGNWWSAFLARDTGDESMGAVGQFHAVYTNIGRMTGTFGARKTQ